MCECGPKLNEDWRLERAKPAERLAFAEILEIQCIGIRPVSLERKRIVAVGGSSADGTLWKMEQHEAIAAIETGRASFWIEGAAGASWIVVAASASGRKYLKAREDGEQPSRLLALPSCL